MVNSGQQGQGTGLDKSSSGQAEVIQGQLSNMLSGVERSLAVTCESIMSKMKQLEEKMEDMEKRYTKIAEDAEKVLKETSSETGDDAKQNQTGKQ